MEFIFPALDDEIVERIKMGLPSPNIRKYATTLVLRHPKANTFIILKWRLPAHITEALTESDFEELYSRRTWDADWSDITGKHIIVSPSILNIDARMALLKL